MKTKKKAGLSPALRREALELLEKARAEGLGLVEIEAELDDLASSANLGSPAGDSGLPSAPSIAGIH
jgi:hypothetical protein